jgi:nucleotide-binding universal stress UspA family protein
MSVETILVAVGPGDRDRTARLAEETIDIAGPTEASVVLLHAFTEDGFEDAARKVEFDPSKEYVSPDVVAKRQMSINELGERFDQAGIEYETRGVIGPPEDKIVAVAEEVGADRLFVGGRDRSPTGKAIFGSVAQAVMLSAPCPVTFVRSEIDE